MPRGPKGERRPADVIERNPSLIKRNSTADIDEMPSWPANRAPTSCISIMEVAVVNTYAIAAATAVKPTSWGIAARFRRPRQRDGNQHLQQRQSTLHDTLLFLPRHS
jgi:hypothetical protein